MSPGNRAIEMIYEAINKPRCPQCFRVADYDMPTVVKGLGDTVKTCAHFPDCRPDGQTEYEHVPADTLPGLGL